MTEQQKIFLRLVHTLSQNCSNCYDNYLYDRGKECDKLDSINNIVVDGIKESGIPDGIG